MTPSRIQRQRTKGWRGPAGAVYVGRPTRWGNPWEVGDAATRTIGGYTMRGVAVGHFENAEISYEHTVDMVLTAEDVVQLYRWDIEQRACHADVLLEVANR